MQVNLIGASAPATDQEYGGVQGAPGSDEQQQGGRKNKSIFEQFDEQLDDVADGLLNATDAVLSSASQVL